MSDDDHETREQRRRRIHEIVERVKDIAERRLAELLADEPPRDAAKLH